MNCRVRIRFFLLRCSFVVSGYLVLCYQIVRM